MAAHELRKVTVLQEQAAAKLHEAAEELRATQAEVDGKSEA